MSRGGERILLGLLLLFFLVNVGLFVWGIPRGFDVKDEAFMLLSLRYPMLYASLTTSFHLIIDRLLGAFDLGVVAYRWVGFGLKLAATGVFAFGLWQWLVASASREVQPPSGKS